MKKYLPSKKFVYLLISFVIIAFVFFIVFELFSNKNSFFASKNGTLGVDRLTQAGLTVNQLIQKDSDGDGIADWEEALWGTDPNNKMTFPGITDSAYIAGKKKELNVAQTEQNDANLTETDKFAREFFAAYTAMKASGKVDPNDINNFSGALGQNIVNATLIDHYSLKDIKTSTDNSIQAKTKYYESVKKLFDTYKTKGIGDELGIINEQLTSPAGTENPDKLTPIAEAYQDFASGVVKITVPDSLSAEHLKIANSANNTGISILSMTKITGDPIVGLSGISKYQKYSDDLVSAVTDLEAKIKQ